MHHDPLMDPPQKGEYGSLQSYVLGFLISLVLTLAAYILVVQRIFTDWMLDLAVAILAIAQALLQLALFLNLAKEAKPRWKLIVFLFMVLIVVILVFGSLWIMNHLNYNLMAE